MAKLDRDLDAERRDVVADQILIAFLIVKLDRKSTHVPRGIDRTCAARDSRAARKDQCLDPVQSGFYLSNAASTRTRGLDIVASWRADLGAGGSALLTLSGNLNQTIFTRLDVPDVLADIGVSLIDRARQGDFTKGTPRNKIIANLNWTRGDAMLNLRATRYGEVTQVAARTVTVDGDTYYPDEVIAPKTIFDLELSYALAQGVRIAAGANNLFNIYPTKLSAVNQGTSGFSLYNPYSPYGISGGFYYGKLALTF